MYSPSTFAEKAPLTPHVALRMTHWTCVLDEDTTVSLLGANAYLYKHLGERLDPFAVSKTNGEMSLAYTSRKFLMY